MVSVILSIDYREKDFISKLSELCEDKPENSETTICNVGQVKLVVKIVALSVGDFMFEFPEDNTKMPIIVERKSVKDLSASITDGRFREQKQRLEDSGCDIVYLIEGSKSSVNSGISQTILDGSVLNLIFRHRYKVLRTENKNDTFQTIVLLYKKLQNNDFDQNNQSKLYNGSNNIKSKKQKIQETMLAHQLSVIPGVSFPTALALQNEYHSLANLINMYNMIETQNEREILLSNFELPNKRKIGKALSKKIYQALFNST